MNIHIEELKTKGYVSMAYPTDMRLAVEKTIGSWKKFCDLPNKVKTSLPYSNNADGVGYELKEGVGNKADKKENFDVTINGQKWLQKNLKEIDNKTALDFVKDVTSLVQIIKPTILNFASQSEKAFGLENFSKEVEESEGTFFIRFIHYFGDRNLGEETASAHVDQSGFSLHLFESAPGLEYLSYDGKWLDMPVSSGETVIIPSMQMQLRSENKLKALCHRVVATSETSKQGRYSAVCFVQFKNTKKYDKSTNGRLQERVPGFNYEMSIEDFSKLFK